MKLIQYIGNRPDKTDHVTGSGLTWTPGQVQPVTDEVAVRLLGFPSVWQIAQGEPNGKTTDETPRQEACPETAQRRARLLKLRSVA